MRKLDQDPLLPAGTWLWGSLLEDIILDLGRDKWGIFQKEQDQKKDKIAGSGGVRKFHVKFGVGVDT